MVWAAIDDAGEVVGEIRLSPRSGRNGRDVIGESYTIDEVWVDGAHQRRGLGTRLMRTAEAWMRERDDRPHTLGLGVNTDNDGAIALYRGMGYRIAVAFTGVDGQVCYAMYKRL
jgi:ribosomal protein S18 acetylase RimI-like enzyme